MWIPALICSYEIMENMEEGFNKFLLFKIAEILTV